MRGNGGGNGINRPPGVGMHENRRDDSNNIANNSRQNWNDRDRDDEPKPIKTRFEESDDTKDTKRSASRWGDSSPKSVVSDEENWDEESELPGVDDDDNDNGNDVEPKKTVATKIIAEPTLPQTEPIDDDSQEDDFNDFDETVAAADTIEDIVDDTDKHTEAIETIEQSEKDSPMADDEPDEPKRMSPIATVKHVEPYDMFSSEPEPTATESEPTNNYDEQVEAKSNTLEEKESEEINQNTTPLYDEPENDEDEFVPKQNERVKTPSPVELEQPAIPGIDPTENENEE